MYRERNIHVVYMLFTCYIYVELQINNEYTNLSLYIHVEVQITMSLRVSYLCVRGVYMPNKHDFMRSVKSKHINMIKKHNNTLVKPQSTLRSLDLEVVPHSRQVHVPSDTLRTWKWSPTQERLPSKRNGFEKKPTKTKILLVFYNVLLFLPKN